MRNDFNRHALSDEQWDRFGPAFLAACGPMGRKPADNRAFVDALFWMGSTGSPWRDMPVFLGSWQSVYKRFARLCLRGVFERLFEILRGKETCQIAFADSTSCKAAPWAAGARRAKQSMAGARERQKLGKSRGGMTTKVHAFCDEAGRLFHCFLSKGEQSDFAAGPRLFAAALAGGASKVVGDKGYDSNALIAQVEAAGAEAVIPSKSNRKTKRPHDAEVYKQRNLIERCFRRLKQARAICLRSAKRGRIFLAWVLLFGAKQWL